MNNDTTSSAIRSSASYDKYHGLIQQPLFKRIRNSIFSFVAYIYSVSSPFYWLHPIVTFWRVSQLLMACLVSGFAIWKKGTFNYDFINVFCTVFYFVPVDQRQWAAPYLIAYIVIMFFYNACIVALSLYFQRTANIPTFLPNIIMLFNATVNYLIHPSAIVCLGELIGRLVFGLNRYVLPVSILIAVLVFLTAFFSIFTIKFFVARSILFRPNSLMTLDCDAQSNAVFLIYLVILAINIGTRFGKTGQVICAAIGDVLYLVLFILILLSGGYVHTSEYIALSSAAGAGFVCLLINVFLIYFEVEGNAVELIVMVVVFILFNIIIRFLQNKTKQRHIQLLDEFMDDENVIDNVKNTTHLQNIAITGFSYAHPACLNWSFLQAGVKKWPTNMNAWFAYAKFVAIYPEETYLLTAVSRSIEQNEIHGSFAKQVLDEIGSVLRMREGNLSISLKQKLNSINRDVLKTKHKLRNVWDMAIQGNIGEMEHSITATYTAVNKCNAQFNHLLRQYPNNRFITRAYSRFLLDVCADAKGFEKYDTDTKTLQRGGKANDDQAFVLGLHYFPALPKNLKTQAQGNMSLVSEDTNMSQSSVDANDTFNEQMDTISENFDDVRFPALQNLSIAIFLYAFICFFCVLIIFSVYGESVVATTFGALQYVYKISYLQILVTMEQVCAMYKPVVNNKLLPDNLNYVGYGGKEVINDQIVAIVNDIVLYTEELNELNTYELYNGPVTKTRNELFITMLNFTKTDGTFSEVKTMSAVNTAFEYAFLGSSLNYKFNEIVVENYLVTMIMNNVDNVMNNLETSASSFYADISSNESFISKIILIFTIAFECVLGLGWLILNIYFIHKVRNEKEEVYRCFTSLQKNVVSAISDKLKIIKKTDKLDDTSNSESDGNKQDENLMKIFATAGDSFDIHSSYEFTNIVVSVFCFVVFCVICIIFYLQMSDSMNRITKCSPHINFLLGSFANTVSYTADLFFMLAMNKKDASSEAFKKLIREKCDHIRTLQAKSISLFNMVRYGMGSDLLPFEPFVNRIISADYIGDLSAEQAFTSMHVYANELVGLYTQTEKVRMDAADVEDMWILLNHDLYFDFFRPFFADLIQMSGAYISTNMARIVTIDIIIAFVILLLEVFVYVQNMLFKNRLKFSLKLLQHCPVSVIQQSSRIMAIMSGNFGAHKVDKTTRDSDYFKEVILNLPDSIFLVNKENVQIMNNAALRLFGVEHFEPGPLESFIPPGNSDFLVKLNALSDVKATKELQFKRDDLTFDLEVSVMSIKEDHIYTLRDNTLNKRYNTLIAAERNKSDMLLASILPPKLVPRVQAGEKDISFEVQSASVLFMDIVSFTPWCASTTAEVVMSTLNRLFTEFDALVSKSQTLTRIKCIGDCYMAAGGIFAEINQPELHAKEMVQFGLDAISTVEKVNGEIGQNLNVRVGVNTGGPLVAGVIGTGKPTFEIIGPVINMAQQMEHHGVPMCVHISRPVYELIYGGSFNIRERGQVELKNGVAVTYLVSGSV